MVYQIAFMLFFLTYPMSAALVSRSGQHRPDLNQIESFKKAREIAKKQAEQKTSARSYTDLPAFNALKVPTGTQLEPITGILHQNSKEAIAGFKKAIWRVKGLQKHQEFLVTPLVSPLKIEPPLKIGKSSPAYEPLKKLRQEKYQGFIEEAEENFSFSAFEPSDSHIPDKFAAFLKVHLSGDEKKQLAKILEDETFEDAFILFRFADYLGIDDVVSTVIDELANKVGDYEKKEDLQQLFSELQMPALYQEKIIAKWGDMNLHPGMLNEKSIKKYVPLKKAVLSPDSRYIVGVNDSNQEKKLTLIDLDTAKEEIITTVNDPENIELCTFDQNSQEVLFIFKDSDRYHPRYLTQRYSIKNKSISNIWIDWSQFLDIYNNNSIWGFEWTHGTYLDKNGKYLFVLDSEDEENISIFCYDIKQNKLITKIDNAMPKTNHRFVPIMMTTSFNEIVAFIFGEPRKSDYCIDLFDIETGNRIGERLPFNFFIFGGRKKIADFFFSKDDTKLAVVDNNRNTGLIVDIKNRKKFEAYYIKPKATPSTMLILSKIDKGGLSVEHAKTIKDIIRNAKVDRNALIVTWKSLFSNYENPQAEKVADFLLTPFQIKFVNFKNKSQAEQENFLLTAPYDLETLTSKSTTAQEEYLDLLDNFIYLPLDRINEMSENVTIAQPVTGFATVAPDHNTWLLKYEGDQFPVLWNMAQSKITNLNPEKNSVETIVKDGLYYMSQSTYNKPKPKILRSFEQSFYSPITQYPQFKIITHDKRPLAYAINQNAIDVWNLKRKIRVQSISFGQSKLHAIAADKKNETFLISSQDNTWIIKADGVKDSVPKKLVPEKEILPIASGISKLIGPVTDYIKSYFSAK